MADIAWLTARPIAHRGLHDDNRAVCENSLSAARAAADAGFAIECDIQLSADGTPFVFHDDTLERMTGAPGRFREMRDAELSSLRLAQTADGIPTLAAFLAAIGGAVPVIVELKGESAESDGHFVEAIRPHIAGYSGELALMSFDPWLVEAMLAAKLGRPVGLTAEGTARDDLDRHWTLFDKGCAFTSYSVHQLPNPFVTHVRETAGCPVLSWTVRTLEERDWSALHADQITFEGFRPQP